MLLIFLTIWTALSPNQAKVTPAKISILMTSIPSKPQPILLSLLISATNQRGKSSSITFGTAIDIATKKKVFACNSVGTASQDKRTLTFSFQARDTEIISLFNKIEQSKKECSKVDALTSLRKILASGFNDPYQIIIKYVETKSRN